MSDPPEPADGNKKVTDKSVETDLAELNINSKLAEPEPAEGSAKPKPADGPSRMVFDGTTFLMDDETGCWVFPYLLEQRYPKLVGKIHEKEGNYNPDVWQNDPSKKPKSICWDYENKCSGRSGGKPGSSGGSHCLL
ncbi:hypothetical protein QR680_004795 [Steinernema hermaphroditum]|uniref:Uncharacterized protein n=1 Tax=Steinernema hermaphroditum TaxID=289476 RepID=A0AA39LU93_9BILA|nr:hypothetical protein QR680_004795 [Steinernema hermaphroditum]